ncbi:hypothetical protein PG996_011743 [Apiospora saccharicola]|uniref:Uncharacterized protein n=1 Tax=Apiospora saccharicola TaxID=335842 RepID=A0ABR1UFW5_9PEZI
MDSDGQVYLGAWTNWSKGHVMGATLTMTREDGNLVIAFTAFFIPFVVSRLWKSFAMLFHQCYSTSDSRDAIHHQRQVLLRSSPSPESSLMPFARMIWTWQGTAKRPWLRVFPVALLSFLCIGIATVAGGYSSKISTAGEVLLRGDTCEITTTIGSGNITQQSVSRSFDANHMNDIANYAQQCYSNQSSGLLECSKFIANTISTAVADHHAACPFRSDVCRNDSTNLRLDSGHISSDVLGLNAPKDERMSLRVVPTGAKQVNYTFAVPDVETQYAKPGPGLLLDNKFLISAMKFHVFQGSLLRQVSAFMPHPEIIRRDGDVTLIFLSGNGLVFVPQAVDEWYRATIHNGYVHLVYGTDGLEQYHPEEAASPLGCVEQYQWCRDPSRGQCGDLTGRMDALYSAGPWFNLTSEDLDPARPVATTRMGSLLIWAYFNIFQSDTSLDTLIHTLGPSSLSSNTVARQGSVGKLEANQWQIDVTRWWSILLAGFQASFVSTARGRTNSSFRPDDTIRPANEYEWDICRNQKIRSAQYSSFTIFGLVFTYSMGALIVIVSFIISPLLCFLQERGRYNKYAYLEWEGHTAIQLHRVAQDQCGYGRWSRCDEEIPITRPDDMLAPFDISDPEHPMLASAPEDATAEEKSSHHDQTPQESSLEPSDEEGSSRHTFSAVRRATADGHFQGPRSDHFPSADGDLEANSVRPSTGP